MAKIIVAFAEEQQCARIAGALEESGLPVLRRCSSGAEVLRALNLCEDAVLVCGTKFADHTADSLAEDMSEQALMLVVGRPERLALCESTGVFRLASPFGRAELVSSVRMLLQLHDMRKPKRDGDEKELIERAKRLLMERKGLSEAQAHQTLQRASMNLGLRMTECARRILNGDGLQ